MLSTNNLFTTTQRFIVTTSPGLSSLLERELNDLGLTPVLEPSGIVSFEGDFYQASKVLLHSRIASRVLLSVRKFSARTSAMLYDQVRRVEWPHYFSNQQTFAVYAHGDNKDCDYALSFAPLKIKDAICDEFRKFNLDRPSVARINPDARLEAFVHGGKCELSLDLSGEPLHRRGYRTEGSDAPLRESRAAALLLFAGYDGSQALVDPFCGSGTIAIEAALIAAKKGPGLLRNPKEFALLRLFKEASEPFTRAFEEAKSMMKPPGKNIIYASDMVGKALRISKENAKRAGVLEHIQVENADARDLRRPNSMIVTNPPYGERLADEQEAGELISAFTRQAKHECPNSTLTFILPRGNLEKAVGFKSKRKLLLDNGPIPSVFLHYELYSGSRKVTRE